MSIDLGEQKRLAGISLQEGKLDHAWKQGTNYNIQVALDWDEQPDDIDEIGYKAADLLNKGLKKSGSKVRIGIDFTFEGWGADQEALMQIEVRKK
jgi:hypothetical protein